GLAEYFSTCRVDGGQVMEEGGILPARLADLIAFLRGGGPEPFAKIMRQTPREFYEGPVAQKYAQAWSMIHFFEQGAEGKYRKSLDDSLRACVAGKTAGQAFDETFGQLDLARVEGQWRAHVEGLANR